MDENLENPRGRAGLWIPDEVFSIPGLPLAGKVLWAEIHSLYHGALKIGVPGCFKSNERLGEDLGISGKYIEKLIGKLKGDGLIEQVSFDGRKRYLRTTVSYSGRGEGPTPVGCRVLPESDHRIKDRVKDRKVLSSEDDDVFKTIWETRKSGRKRDTNKAKAFQHFKARLKDGFTPDQLKRSITNYNKQCEAEGRKETMIKQVQFFFSDKGLVEGSLRMENEPEYSPRETFEAACPYCQTIVKVTPDLGGYTECPGCGLQVRDFGQSRDQIKKILEMEGLREHTSREVARV